MVARLKAVRGDKEINFKVDSLGLEPAKEISMYYRIKTTIAVMIPGFALVKKTEIKID